MKPKCFGLVFAVLILSSLLLNSTTHAQFTTDYQTNTISGTTVDWTGTYDVGSNAVYDLLDIDSGGALVSDAGAIGVTGPSAGNDAVLVSGAGSIWSNRNDLSIGSVYQYPASSDDSLTITSGGAVYDDNCTVGGVNTVILVSGNSSVWNNSGDITLIGPGDWGNGGNHSMTIAAGAVLIDNALDMISGGTLLVTDAGSVWSNRNDLSIESEGGDSLVISNGGAVYDANGYIGGFGFNNGLVTGIGSVWSNSNSLWVGAQLDTLTISNGGVVYSPSAYLVGYPSPVLVTGVGSVLHVDENLYIDGWSDLTIADEGVVCAPSVENEAFITVSGGWLYVTNGLGTGALTASYDIALTLNSGTITVDSLICDDEYGNIAFNGGTLNSKGTVVSGRDAFTVGDGTDVATLHLDSGGTGIHSFTNGLTISTNAFLTGCGTIEGSVVVDYGGTVRANCGGSLNFADSVINNGIIRVRDGTTLNFYGPVVNNGVIEARKGHVRFWSTVQNNGKIVPRGHIVIESDLHHKRR